MNDVEIERKRASNLTRVISRGLTACSQADAQGDADLEMLLNGPHAKVVVLGILEFSTATASAIARGARLWQPFGGKEHLLYDLVTDKSELGIQRVKNLLDAGWDPNHALPGSGRTALMQVTNNWAESNRAMVSLLLAAGADAGMSSVSGQTALDYAPTVMRNYIRAFAADVAQDTTNRTGRRRALAS